MSAYSGRLHRAAYGAGWDHGVQLSLDIAAPEHFDRSEPTALHVHNDEPAFGFQIKAFEFVGSVAWRWRCRPVGDDMERSAVGLPTPAPADKMEPAHLRRQFSGLRREQPL